MIGDLKVTDTESTYGNYFADGCHPKLDSQDIIVKSVEAQVDFHLNRLRLGTSLLQDATVKTVCKEIVSKQGKLVQGPVASAFDSVIAEVADMTSFLGLMENKDRLNLTSIAKKMKGFKQPLSAKSDVPPPATNTLTPTQTHARTSTLDTSKDLLAPNTEIEFGLNPHIVGS